MNRNNLIQLAAQSKSTKFIFITDTKYFQLFPPVGVFTSVLFVYDLVEINKQLGVYQDLKSVKGLFN